MRSRSSLQLPRMSQAPERARFASTRCLFVTYPVPLQQKRSAARSRRLHNARPALRKVAIGHRQKREAGGEVGYGLHGPLHRRMRFPSTSTLGAESECRRRAQ